MREDGGAQIQMRSQFEIEYNDIELEELMSDEENN